MDICFLCKYNNSLPFCKDGNFSTALELAVRFGKTLIIQEVDNIEPVLFPVLRNDLISQGIFSCIDSNNLLQCASNQFACKAHVLTNLNPLLDSAIFLKFI